MILFDIIESSNKQKRLIRNYIMITTDTALPMSDLIKAGKLKTIDEILFHAAISNNGRDSHRYILTVDVLSDGEDYLISNESDEESVRKIRDMVKHHNKLVRAGQLDGPEYITQLRGRLGIHNYHYDDYAKDGKFMTIRLNHAQYADLYIHTKN